MPITHGSLFGHKVRLSALGIILLYMSMIFKCDIMYFDLQQAEWKILKVQNERREGKQSTF